MTWCVTKLVLWLSRAIHVFFSVGPTCRFVPSCSEFACTAISKHGIIRGFVLFLGRIFRCHPWGGSGWDPVPEK